MGYKRKYVYHECERCGCNLDPGEGSYCDECKAEIEKEDAECEQKLKEQKDKNVSEQNK